ncbi:MAG TPA: VOC family protein [Candidatus Acidoferrales bacterium]|nr:VOC family protein [Candidatus Acidoferrales bacterium]
MTNRLVVCAAMILIGSGVAVGFGSSAGSFPQSAPSAPFPIKFDHALICVSDLAPMQQALADVGLKPDYGGHHGHATTQMAQLGFADGSYIGVEALVDASVETGTPQSALMKANAGPCGWSATSTDMKGDLERISKLGVKVGEPEVRSRTRPDGALAEWHSASLGAGAPGSNLPFLIEDKGPRSNRAPHASPSTEGTTISGVDIVVLGVKNLDDSIALFRKVYSLPAPAVEDHPEFGAKIAYFPGTPVMLAAASSPDSWVAERVGRLDQIPVAFLLHADDFKAASKHFSLPEGKAWFHQDVSWFDVQKLRGVRLGIIGG